MTHRLSRTTVLIAIALLACATLLFVSPGTAHAASLQLPLPGWLQDMLDQLEIALVKTLQDTARVGGALLWGVLKVCGLVGISLYPSSTPLSYHHIGRIKEVVRQPRSELWVVICLEPIVSVRHPQSTLGRAVRGDLLLSATVLA